MCSFSWCGDLPKAIHYFWEENTVLSAPSLTAAFVFLIIRISAILTLWVANADHLDVGSDTRSRMEPTIALIMCCTFTRF
jgi:hypothetical protein